MVECQLPKLDVAGSSPVSRSNTQIAKLLQIRMAIHNRSLMCSHAGTIREFCKGS